jgi:hypothetical protein
MFHFLAVRNRSTMPRFSGPSCPTVQKREAVRDLRAPVRMDRGAGGAAMPAAHTKRSAIIDHPIVNDVRTALQAAYRRGLKCGQAELGCRLVFLEGEVARPAAALSAPQAHLRHGLL